MRPASRFFMPVAADHLRNRILATFTAVAAAASIAAVAAGSSDADSAATGADDGDAAGASVAGQVFALPEADLAPRSDADSPTDPPIGDIERLSDRQDLPELPGDDAAMTGPATTPAPAGEDEEETASDPVYETVDGESIDAERVFDFLEARDAPLAAHADTIVAAGVAHDVDPRVVVAIAIAESNGAEMKPTGTHNAWGWGGSGPHGLRAWGSWEESIDDFTERLGELYDTDNVDWDFASTYCPPNTRWWYDTVTWAMAEI